MGRHCAPGGIGLFFSGWTMSEMSRLHLLVGVKAEQSLRDEVRAVVDQAEDDSEELELAPVGRKDWIAGVRVTADLSFRRLEEIAAVVLGRLITLDSRQRIRRENVRVYVVQPPVPVFKDPEEAPPPEPTSPEPPPQPAIHGATATCPVCNRSVHSYNLQHDTTGRVVGCYICGGDPSRAGS
jgi:hypothetical protein